MSGSEMLFDRENWTRTELTFFETVPIPEPGIAALFGIGVAGLIGYLRRGTT
ncbi:MAG: PEP-CTERM sorting domain-containing protein [Rhodospirillaceae bacterium]|nr:MAG: PEP-CTERM sorting domain-containing protein [Rhodospirillaceae bacterium]